MTAPILSPSQVATGGRRPPPHPNSVLNRQDLLAALDDANITLKEGHLTGFYQSLHRLGYPTLQEFVKIYYEQEEEAFRWNKVKASFSSKVQKNNGDSDNQQQHPITKYVRPLKNNISQTKNRNRLQLPKPFLDFLETTQDFVTITSSVYQAVTSADGSTTKLAVQLYDGQLVESVIMRYMAPPSAGDGAILSTHLPPPRRASLCVSSQVGCAMGCTFCATATMGIRGNLTAGEILEQLVHADLFLEKEGMERRQQLIDQMRKQQPQKMNPPPQVVLSRNLDLVRNVVFMGMGEPLNNYDNVVEACRAMLDRRRWNLAHGRVTVSTVGVTPRMKDLSRDLPEVSLALSLHAPNQAMRSKIVPAAKNYPIEGLIEAMDQHMLVQIYKEPERRPKIQPGDPPGRENSTRRRAMIEYVMLEGDTSSFECAHQLGKLCENRQVVVNLIPYNQTDVRDKLRCPSEAHIKEFQRIVTSYGTFCSVRRTMGADIASACGQLVVKKEKKKKNDLLLRQGEGDPTPPPPPPADLEDGPFAKPTILASRATPLSSSVRVSRRNKAAVAPVSAVTTSAGSAEGVEERNDRTREEGMNSPVEDALDRWIQPLVVSTALAATCFVLSSLLFLRQRRR